MPLRAVPLALILVACAPEPGRGFDDALPSARIDAIVEAARAGDRAAVRSLIEQLDSDDAAVRLVAIEALHRATGETHGYRQYDPPAERRAAVARWERWLETSQETAADG